MKIGKYLILMLVTFTASCSIPEYKGEYINVDCILFEKIIIYADNTADIKYVALPDLINYKITELDSNIIKIDQYEFEVSDEYLVETNVLGKGCTLKKAEKKD